MFCKHPYKIYVIKKATGAIWSCCKGDPGKWTKESLGSKCRNTKPVGYVTRQFNPNTPRNKRRFQAY